jgi:hypothetical protein
MEFVRIGNILDTDRQGSVYLTADDSGAPYIDIIDQISSHSDFNTQGTIKVRLGDLDGIVDESVGLNTSSVYGLYTDSAYLKGNLIVGGNNNVVELSNSTIAIGNITGSADNAIKIADTTTASTSGIFGYNGSGNEVFALRLNSTSSLSNWDIQPNEIRVSGSIHLNSLEEKI